MLIFYTKTQPPTYGVKYSSVIQKTGEKYKKALETRESRKTTGANKSEDRGTEIRFIDISYLELP